MRNKDLSFKEVWKMESKNTGLSIEDKIQIALMVKAMMKEEKKKPGLFGLKKRQTV